MLRNAAAMKHKLKVKRNKLSLPEKGTFFQARSSNLRESNREGTSTRTREGGEEEEENYRKQLTHLDALHGRLVEPLEVAVHPRRRRPRGGGCGARQADHRHEQARDPQRGVHGRRVVAPLPQPLGPSPRRSKGASSASRRTTSPAADSEDWFENIGTVRGCEVGVMAGSLVSGRSSPRLGAERPGQSVQVGSEEQSRWSLPLLPFPSFSFWANGRKRPLRDPETIRPRHTLCYRSNRDQRPLIRGLLGRH
jgi:hypothetical protein